MNEGSPKPINPNQGQRLFAVDQTTGREINILLKPAGFWGGRFAGQAERDAEYKNITDQVTILLQTQPTAERPLIEYVGLQALDVLNRRYGLSEEEYDGCVTEFNATFEKTIKAL